MREIRAIMVDLDGTLADTAAINFEAYRAALGEVGITISREEFDKHSFGRHWSQFLPDLFSRFGIDGDAAAVARKKGKIYATKVADVKLNRPLLDLLRSSRSLFFTALVTTASARNVFALLNHFALANLFDVIVTGDDVKHHKPDPEAYVTAAAKLNVVPSACLIFEDSDNGVASALAFGGNVIRVSLRHAAQYG
jgi:beta-phosphoglucomutase